MKHPRQDQRQSPGAIDLRRVELSPLEIIALEATTEGFCDREQYEPEKCLPWCKICESLLIKRSGESVVPGTKQPV